MGRRAQISGKTAENWVEAGLLQYKINGLAFAQRNWPEIKQQGFKAVVVGKAGPDWTVFVRGRAVQLEVKTWTAKDRHFYAFTGSPSKARRRSQWLTLLDAVKVGGCLGFYLTAWRHPSLPDGVEWRLYDVVAVEGNDYGLEFVRENGLLVQKAQAGWPDWIEEAFKRRS